MADGGVKRAWTLVAILCAFPAHADEARDVLAREIEAVSTTTFRIEPTSFFAVPSFRRALVIEGCDATAETRVDGPTGKRTYGLTSDLHHTRVPDPERDDGTLFAVEDLGDGPVGIIEFGFLSPHAPRWHGELLDGETTAPVSRFNFWMEPFPEGRGPRLLLTLLRRYQADYCTLAG